MCYATSIFLFLGGVKDQTRPTDLSFNVFLPLAIINALLLIGFIFFEYKVFKIKVNIPLVIILTILFFVNLIVILTTPLEKSFEYTYHDNSMIKNVVINNEYKVMYILCFLLLLLNIYISFIYLFNHIKFRKHFVWFCIIGIAFGFITLIYSYIKEWETYKLYIENMATTVRTYNPKSFTNHSNSYAAILLGTAFCSYGLYAVTNKHICWIIGLFFCINIIFPMSRICLPLSILLSLSIFGYKMFLTYRGNEKRNIILITIVVSLLLILLILYLSVEAIRDYIENVVFTKNSSYLSRLPLLEVALSMTYGVHSIFGNGHGYFNTAFSSLLNGEPKMPHNLYVQTYGALGFVGIALLIALVVFVIYKIVKLYKTNQEASLISTIGLVMVLIYYLVEG